MTLKHNLRIKDDPDFIYIKEQFDLKRKNAEQTHISLNEKKRRTEKELLEQQALAIENKRRKAKGEQLFKTVKEYKDFQEAEEEKQNANYGSKDSQIDVKDDAMLTEAGHILVDLARALETKSVAIQTPLKKATLQ